MATYQHHRRSATHCFQAAAVAVAVAVSGCQQKMADQPSFKPLQPNPFFADGRSARPLVAGTVARGHLQVDDGLFTGRSNAVQQSADGGAASQRGGIVGGGPQSSGQPPSQTQQGQQDAEATGRNATAEQSAGGFDEDAAFLREFPIPINESVIRHGYNRYMIYCVVCHDPLGTGYGKIVERGYSRPPSYHIDRLRNAPVGRLFAVVSEGYGSMPSYKGQIPVEDRWAIVAYVKALQLSRHFPEAELTPEMRAAMDKALGAQGESEGAAPGPANNSSAEEVP